MFRQRISMVIASLCLTGGVGAAEEVAELTPVRIALIGEAKILWKKDLNIFTAIHQFRHRDGLLYAENREAGGLLGITKTESDERYQG